MEELFGTLVGIGIALSPFVIYGVAKTLLNRKRLRVWRDCAEQNGWHFEGRYVGVSLLEKRVHMRAQLDDCQVHMSFRNHYFGRESGDQHTYFEIEAIPNAGLMKALVFKRRGTGRDGGLYFRRDPEFTRFITVNCESSDDFATRFDDDDANHLMRMHICPAGSMLRAKKGKLKWGTSRIPQTREEIEHMVEGVVALTRLLGTEPSREVLERWLEKEKQLNPSG